MAKSVSKKTKKEEPKKAPKKQSKETQVKVAKKVKKAAKKVKAVKPKETKKKSINIEEAAVAAKEKLQSLGLNPQLQSDLDWCLGSYRYDGQPGGLYHYVNLTIDVLKAELSKKTKGIKAEFIATLETAVK